MLRSNQETVTKQDVHTILRVCKMSCTSCGREWLPKTLRQILYTLIGSIVNALAGNNFDKQTIAGRMLGEIVHKLGEYVTHELDGNEPRSMY